MIIKVWNNYDLGVFRINRKALKGLKVQKRFTKTELKAVRRVAKEFTEQLAVEFEHNLIPGWKSKILAAGTVLDKSGSRELKTTREITKELTEHGGVQFFVRQILARQKSKSLEFIDSIRKPKDKRWS